MCLHLITWYSQHSLIWQLVVKIFFLKPELLEQNWIHEIFCQIALCKFDFMKMFSLEERVLVMVSREMTPKSREILGSKTRFLTFPLCVQGKWPFWLKNFSWKQFHSLITSISHNFCKKRLELALLWWAKSVVWTELIRSSNLFCTVWKIWKMRLFAVGNVKLVWLSLEMLAENGKIGLVNVGNFSWKLKNKPG